MRLMRTCCLTGAILALALRVCGAQDSEGICPMSDEQQTKAVNAFASLLPIFREPRCSNCHGGVNPFGNVRGQHPDVGAEEVCMNRDRSPAKCGDPGATQNFNETFAICGTCHTQISPGESGASPPLWQLANSSIQWVDPPGFTPKSSLDLCKQQKGFFREDPDSFPHHWENDDNGIQFIAAAFAGKRALEEDPHDKGVIWPDPPRSMTRSEMLKRATDWYEAMGRHFPDPPECGCVESQYALRVKFHGTFAVQSPVATHFDFDSSDSAAQPVLIPIKFKEGGAVSGTGTIGGTGAGTVQMPIGQCAANGVQRIGVAVTGVWPALQAPNDAQPGSGDRASKVTLKLQVSDLTNRSQATCFAMGLRGTGGSNQPGSEGYSFSFTLDPVVGATQSVPWSVPLPGWTGTAQVTLVRMK
jgi:hypothetical protein